ncbi:hypothetical protein HWV62_15223 [Athelia sp. TMB]|nr:hypothetical protein HWV62_15223 [Athelia sp. TMB]
MARSAPATSVLQTYFKASSFPTQDNQSLVIPATTAAPSPPLSDLSSLSDIDDSSTVWMGGDLEPSLGEKGHFSVRPTMDAPRSPSSLITSITGLSESIPQKRKRQTLEVYIDMPPRKVKPTQNHANGKEKGTITQPNDEIEMADASDIDMSPWPGSGEATPSDRPAKPLPKRTRATNSARLRKRAEPSPQSSQAKENETGASTLFSDPRASIASNHTSLTPPTPVVDDEPHTSASKSSPIAASTNILPITATPIIREPLEHGAISELDAPAPQPDLVLVKSVPRPKPPPRYTNSTIDKKLDAIRDYEQGLSELLEQEKKRRKAGEISLNGKIQDLQDEIKTLTRSSKAVRSRQDQLEKDNDTLRKSVLDLQEQVGRLQARPAEAEGDKTMMFTAEAALGMMQIIGVSIFFVSRYTH